MCLMHNPALRAGWRCVCVCLMPNTALRAGWRCPRGCKSQVVCRGDFVVLNNLTLVLLGSIPI